MKKKNVALLALIVGACVISGCREVDEITELARKDMEWTEENHARTDGDSMAERIEDNFGIEIDEAKNESSSQETSTYCIGDTIDMFFENGGSMNLIINGCESVYNETFEQTLLKVSYTVENTGNTTIEVGNALFTMYADDYAVESATASDTTRDAMLSAGRKHDGIMHWKINPNDAENIEIEFGDAVIALKSEGELNINYIPLEYYITFDQTADDMAVRLEEAGLGIGYLETRDSYGLSDESLIIQNSDMGTEISMTPSLNNKFSICGINSNMSLEKANEILLNRGTVEELREGDVVVWQYIIDGKYSIIIYGAGENGILFSFYPYADAF